jgi:hypothetical protein
MALDSAQKRYSAMNTMSPWRGTPALPSGTIGGAIRQAIAFLYSGIVAQAGVTIAFVADLNTRLLIYLQAYYTSTNTDLATLTHRYLRDDATGDYTARMRQLISDATEAMP